MLIVCYTLVIYLSIFILVYVIYLQSEIGANITLLKQKDGEVKDTLSRLENQEQITIDDAVVTTAPLYRQ